MAGATLTTAATLIAEKFAAGVSVNFQNDEFLRLFPQRAQDGDTGVRWPVKYSGNSSFTTMTEGAAAPTPGNQSFLEALVPWVYFHGTAKVTGQAVDQVGSASTYNGASLMAVELSEAQRDLVDYMNTYFLGTGANGIRGIIDDDTTDYAGISRTTYTWWQSNIPATVNGILLADYQDMVEAIQDAERAGKVTHILAPWNQITNYTDLATNGANALAGFQRVIIEPGRGQGALDLGHSAAAFQGVPFTPIRDLANSTVLFLDMSPGLWELVSIRTPRVEMLAKTNDDTTWYITAGSALVCKNPRKQGALQGITA